MTLTAGDLIDGKYSIVRVIGEGGMGLVYEGENLRIHRRVAIKVLHPNMATAGDVVARFEKEAQAAGRIGSKHIVEVLDLGNLADGSRYMVMEFLEGQSLGQRLDERIRMEPGELFPIAHQLLEGLAAAHSAGIIHRDLKPDNVFLLKSKDGPDFVKLLDFGISKFSTQGQGEFSMTRTGSVMGSPYYMSPEQAKGSKHADHRVDIYAAGVILYEACSGDVPYKADTFNELLFKIALEPPVPIERVVPDIDLTFAAVVGKAMARDPNERYQSAREFQAALEDWAGVPPPTRVPLTFRSSPGRVLTPDPSLQSSVRSTTPAKTMAASSSSAGWAQSAVPPRKRPPIVAIALIGGLVLGAGAVAAFKIRSGSTEPIPSSAAAPEGSPAKSVRLDPLPPPPAAQTAIEIVPSSTPTPSASTAPASAAVAAHTAAAPHAHGAPAPAAAPPHASASTAPAALATTAAAPAPVPAHTGRVFRRDL